MTNSNGLSANRHALLLPNYLEGSLIKQQTQVTWMSKIAFASPLAKTDLSYKFRFDPMCAAAWWVTCDTTHRETEGETYSSGGSAACGPRILKRSRLRFSSSNRAISSRPWKCVASNATKSLSATNRDWWGHPREGAADRIRGIAGRLLQGREVRVRGQGRHGGSTKKLCAA